MFIIKVTDVLCFISQCFFFGYTLTVSNFVYLFVPRQPLDNYRTVATPLASLLGVKETVRLKAPHNTTLESHYCNITKNPTQVNGHTS